MTGPHQVGVGDITFRKVGSRWRYLTIVMDPYTRRIIAWSLTRRWTATVTRLGMQQSATVGGPGDNAHAESFFHSLKAELTRGVTHAYQRNCCKIPGAQASN